MALPSFTSSRQGKWMNAAGIVTEFGRYESGQLQIARRGHCFKKGGGFSTFGQKNWKRREFLLSNWTLCYVDTETGATKGTIDLRKATDLADAHDDAECMKPFSFKFTAEGRTFYIQPNGPTGDQGERTAWKAAIQDIIDMKDEFGAV